MIRRLECTISGRVQMVMYRDFTRRNARALGVVGAVRNNDDGTVSVVAEGEEAALRALLEKLRRGPLFAKVERIQEAWKEASGAFTDFKIIY